MPRCRPESASICDAPLSLKAWVISFGMSDLSPVIRAFMMAFVSGLLNPILSIASPVEAPMALADSMMPSINGPLIERISVVAPHKMPQNPRHMHMTVLRHGADAERWTGWNRKSADAAIAEKIIVREI